MRLNALLGFLCFTTAAPNPDNGLLDLQARQATCTSSTCYQQLVNADRIGLGNAKKDCTSFQGTIITPCGTTKTKAVSTTATVTLTTILVPTGTWVATFTTLGSFSTPSASSPPACTPITVTNTQPRYADTSCTGTAFADACGCTSVTVTTTTLKTPAALTFTTTSFVKTKTITTTTTTSVWPPPTLPACYNPLKNGNFAGGTLTPWINYNGYKNGGAGTITTQLPAPGYSSAFMANLTTVSPYVFDVFVDQILTTCPGVTYTCTFAHAYQLPSGTPEGASIAGMIASVNGPNIWGSNFGDAPVPSQWYNGSFTFNGSGNDDLSLWWTSELEDQFTDWVAFYVTNVNCVGTPPSS